MGCLHFTSGRCRILPVREQTTPAATVRELRLQKEISQADLARLAGVSWAVIYRAEQGLPIRLLSQAKIARALEVERDELFPEEVAAS